MQGYNDLPEDVRAMAEACYIESEQLDSYGIIATIGKFIMASPDRATDVWNYDITAAGLDRRLWLATQCGKVTVSRWSDKRKAWEGLATGEKPIAWQAYTVPSHPGDHPQDADSIIALEPTEADIAEYEYQRGAEIEFQEHVSRLHRERNWE